MEGEEKALSWKCQKVLTQSNAIMEAVQFKDSEAETKLCQNFGNEEVTSKSQHLKQSLQYVEAI